MRKSREPKQGEGIWDFLGVITAMLLCGVFHLIYYFFLIATPLFVLAALWNMWTVYFG